MDLREVGWEDVDLIHLAQSKDKAGTCDHVSGPSISTKGGEFLD